MFETLQDAIKHYAKCMKCSPSEAKEDAEREISFKIYDHEYSLTMTQHRKKKEG